MKRVFFTILLAISSTIGLCQSNDEQGVRQTLDQMTSALKANDANAIDKMYADDYTFVTPQGTMMNKAQRLAIVKSGQIKYESFDYEDVKVRTYGNTGIVNAIAKVKLTGQDPTLALVTLVFVKKK